MFHVKHLRMKTQVVFLCLLLLFVSISKIYSQELVNQSSLSGIDTGTILDFVKFRPVDRNTVDSWTTLLGKTGTYSCAFEVDFFAAESLRAAKIVEVWVGALKKESWISNIFVIDVRHIMGGELWAHAEGYARPNRLASVNLRDKNLNMWEYEWFPHFRVKITPKYGDLGGGFKDESPNFAVSRDSSYNWGIVFFSDGTRLEASALGIGCPVVLVVYLHDPLFHVKQPKTAASLSAFPNPCRAGGLLNLSGLLNQNGMFAIFDLGGRKITDIAPPLMLPSELTPGIYTVQSSNGESCSFTVIDK